MNSTLIRAGDLAEHDRQRAFSVISQLDGGKMWRVTIELVKSQRTNQQNRYLWGCCYPVFMQHLPGWDAEDVHTFMCGEHFGWETIEGFGKKRVKPIRRSSKLSKKEFAEFVDFIQRKAATMGLFIPDPEPYL